MVKFNENAIREAAYYNWQNAGCPQGKDEYFWSMAVEQLNGKSASSASCGTKKPAQASLLRLLRPRKKLLQKNNLKHCFA